MAFSGTGSCSNLKQIANSTKDFIRWKHRANTRVGLTVPILLEKTVLVGAVCYCSLTKCLEMFYKLILKWEFEPFYMFYTFGTVVLNILRL